MKKSLIALAAVLAAGVTFAGEADPAGQFATQIDGQRTRAEVKAEAVAAIAAGKLRPSNPHASATVQPKLDSSTTRADVVADFLAHRAESEAFTGEDSGSAYLAKAGRTVRTTQYLATAQ